MFRNLFQALFGSFSRKRKLSEEDRQIVLRMIEQANAIADGSYITDSPLPKPVIPERRKEKRV